MARPNDTPWTDWAACRGRTQAKPGPSSSWWLCSAEAFYRTAKQELERMRPQESRAVISAKDSKGKVRLQAE